MTKIAEAESLELLPQELDQIAGGMSVPTNETQIIGAIIAKDFTGVFSPTPNGPHGIA